jgi:thiol-disulfide isomerase/thioredoxin
MEPFGGRRGKKKRPRNPTIPEGRKGRERLMAESIFDHDAQKALADPEAVAQARELLADLQEPAELLVFAAPTCPNCPHLVRAAAVLDQASSLISLRVVDVTEERDLAARYKVQSVPTIVVDGGLTIVGVRSVEELARLLRQRGGLQGEKNLFASLMEGGRLEEAADMLLAGEAVEAFAELWGESTLEDRIGLMVVAEEVLERDPRGLDDLVPHLISVLLGQDALEGDTALRGDTADLLGKTGHPDARAALQALLKDAHPAVADAARDALEELYQGAPEGDEN